MGRPLRLFSLNWDLHLSLYARSFFKVSKRASSVKSSLNLPVRRLFFSCLFHSSLYCGSGGDIQLILRAGPLVGAVCGAMLKRESGGSSRLHRFELLLEWHRQWVKETCAFAIAVICGLLTPFLGCKFFESQVSVLVTIWLPPYIGTIPSTSDLRNKLVLKWNEDNEGTHGGVWAVLSDSKWQEGKWWDHQKGASTEREGPSQGRVGNKNHSQRKSRV